MKILFVTNVPSPYRVDFFNELGKFCELTVCYERKTASDRNSKWGNSIAKNFKEVFADVKPIGTDKSKGNGIVKVIENGSFDHLIISNYSSPSIIKAIFYCQRKKTPYIIESDGGFYKKDNFLKRCLKKLLFLKATTHFTTCDEHVKYLLSLGVKKENIFKYPFTSLKEEDILKALPTLEEKKNAKQELCIKEDFIVISIGQFIYRKGFDVLLNAMATLPKDIGVYIIGGEPTLEYEELIIKHSLTNVHFIDFKTKEELKTWYKVANCFVLPTREDIWGLVINEAMANGLPIITTDMCIAGLELVKEDENGYIVPVGDDKELGNKIIKILNEKDLISIGNKSLEIIKDYTIETMAQKHLEILELRD